MPTTSAQTDDQQHDKLRKRLEDELTYQNHYLDAGDFDWFLRTAKQEGDKTKFDAGDTVKEEVEKGEEGSGATKPAKDTGKPTPRRSSDDFTAPLARSRTVDPNEMGSKPVEEDTFALKRTATNVGTSDMSSHVHPRPQERANSLGASSMVPPGLGKPALGKASDVGMTPLKKKKESGFFKRLFGKEEKRQQQQQQQQRRTSSAGSVGSTGSTGSMPASRPIQVPVNTTTTSTTVPLTLTTSNESAESRHSVSMSPVSSLEPLQKRLSVSSSIVTSASGSASSSASTIPDKYKDMDPLLARYLVEIDSAQGAGGDDVSAATGLSSLSASLTKVFKPGSASHLHYKDGVIPEHPDMPKLPSAFTQTPRYGKSIELEMFEKHVQQKEKARQQKEASGGRFGGLLKRTKSNALEDSLLRVICNESEASPPINFKPIPYSVPPPKREIKPPMEPLQSVRKMKKVAFATTTFVNDPPQQIPSRHPRKGNVEIGTNGELIIHKVSQEDRANATMGIVVGGSGHLKLVSESPAEQKISIKETPAASDAPSSQEMSKEGSVGSEHTIRNEDKALAAQKAHQSAGTSTTASSETKKDIKIDTPMVRRRKKMEAPVVTLKMDELYTRCCHLREILPIPATLKQIPKGSTDPIPILRLKNPHPSMIEVLSFADFIRIAPVITVCLDGVSLTHEMFRLILSALLYKRYLESLCLRNTPIDTEGWRMLCWFMSMNRAIKKLDITQCPSLTVTEQKVHKHRRKSKASEVPRMVCNMEDRSDMNWALMTASIIYRGGISGLVLSGCKIRDDKMFKDLLNLGLDNTLHLGLAYNDLSLSQCEILAHWLGTNDKCVGLDLGYNDLSDKLEPFIEYARHTKNGGLRLVSLNSCNLQEGKATEDVFNAFSKLNNLKYLDIANNKRLFPGFMNKLCMYLPLFGNLARLGFDDNNLDSVSMVKLCECLPLLSHMNYLTIRGNAMDETVCLAMCRALQSSTTLFTLDLDKDVVPEKYQRKFGFLTMRNMERTLYDDKSKNRPDALVKLLSENHESTIYKDLGIPKGMKFGEALLELVKNLDSAPPERVSKFLTVAAKMRQRMKTTISDLMRLHVQGKLSFEGKEVLIRLVNIDSSISKGVELINDERLRLTAGESSSVAAAWGGKIFEGDKHSVPSSSSSKTSSSVEALKADEHSSAPEAYLEDGTDEASQMISQEAQTFKNPSDAPSAVHLNAKVAPESSDASQYKNVMLHARDPFDMIKLLNGLKAKGLAVTDLYKKGPKLGSSGASDLSAEKKAEFSELEKAVDGEDSLQDGKVEVDDEVMKLYDNVLNDIVKPE